MYFVYKKPSFHTGDLVCQVSAASANGNAVVLYPEGCRIYSRLGCHNGNLAVIKQMNQAKPEVLSALCGYLDFRCTNHLPFSCTKSLGHLYENDISHI